MGAFVPLNLPSGVSKSKPSVIVPPGAHAPTVQIDTLPGAGVAIALMVPTPVAIRVQAEALVVR